MREPLASLGPLRVLLFSPSVEFRQVVRAGLLVDGGRHWRVGESASVVDAQALRLHRPFDLIVVRAPLQDLAVLAGSQDASRLFYVADLDGPNADQAYEVGADDYIRIGPNTEPSVLAHAILQSIRLHRLQREREYFAEILRDRELHAMQASVARHRHSSIDERTHWLRPEWLRRRLTDECRRAIRYRLPLSLVQLEVQGLDEAMRELGGQGTLRVLREVAQRVRAIARQTDVVGHHRQDTCLMILTNTDALGAQRFCERLSVSLAEPIIVDAPASAGDDVTAKFEVKLIPFFGVADFDLENPPEEAVLVERVESYLDQARNQQVAGAICAGN